MWAAGAKQHLTNVFISQTVEDGIEQGAACCWHQGGIGVQGRAGCVSKQPPKGERHPASDKHTQDQDQSGEAPSGAVSVCIRLVGGQEVPLSGDGMGMSPGHTADSSVELQGYRNNH